MALQFREKSKEARTLFVAVQSKNEWLSNAVTYNVLNLNQNVAVQSKNEWLSNLQITQTRMRLNVAVQSKNEWLSNNQFKIQETDNQVAVQSKNEWLSNFSNSTWMTTTGKVAVQSKNEWLSNIPTTYEEEDTKVAVQSKNEWLSNHNSIQAQVWQLLSQSNLKMNGSPIRYYATRVKTEEGRSPI